MNNLKNTIERIPKMGGKTLKVKIDEIVGVVSQLKELGFEELIDIFAVDYPGKEKRHEVIYLLLSMKLNQRITLKVKIAEGNSLPSVVRIFSAANWFEREIYDMNGIKILDHPDLRRILTDYNFEGHPMLKDFPLSGYKEVRYDVDSQKVVYEPVNLSQEFRTFDFLSPWEGTKNSR